jgi:outer membrane protein TolC
VEGGANIKSVKQSRLQISALEMQKNNINTSIEQSIRASVAVVISDFNNIQSANSQAEAAQQNFDLVYDSYYVGESTLLDLIDTQDIKLVAEQAIGYFPFLEPEESVQEIISELESRLLLNQ